MAISSTILEIPFRNPFDDPRYSNEDFFQFSEDAIGKIKSNYVSVGLNASQI
jgi:hypothetical protein